MLRARGGRLVLDGPAAVNELRPHPPSVGTRRAAKAELLALLRARAWPMRVAGQVPSPGSPYYCRGCWRLFPESQLTVVDEPLGRGFRCARCLRSH